MNILDYFSHKPYSLGFSKKYPAYSIIYEDGEIFIIPVSLGPEFAYKIIEALNGAYFEGYLQKERELGVGAFG